MKTGLAAIAVLAVVAAGCGGGGSESNYSLDKTASCVRKAGYRAVAVPASKNSGRLLGVSTSKIQIGLIFHDSADKAKKQMADADALPVRTAIGTTPHADQRRNVIVLWLSGPDAFQPKKRDLAAVDRCLTT